VLPYASGAAEHASGESGRVAGFALTAFMKGCFMWDFIQKAWATVKAVVRAIDAMIKAVKLLYELYREWMEAHEEHAAYA
jgi:hypothetical protein